MFVVNLKKKNFPSRTTKQAAESTEPSKLLSAFDISKEGDIAISGDVSGRVCLWNLATSELAETIYEARPSTQQRVGVCCLALSNSQLFR